MTFLLIILTIAFCAAVVWAVGEYETRRKYEKIIEMYERGQVHTKADLSKIDLSSEFIEHTPTYIRNEKQS